MPLDVNLSQAIGEALRAAGDTTAIREIRSVSGGDINEAAQIQTEKERYFVKWHYKAPPRFFEAEADGLQRLTRSGLIRVPQAIAVDSAFLILQWIDSASGKSVQAAEVLGRQLAEQHSIRQLFYGLKTDNYIGRLPQPNARSDSWIDFYRTQRLGSQMIQAQANRLMPAHRSRKLEEVMANLDRWITETDCQPSLLHGDLWGGNWMQTASGEPVLIDPAVYYGDREADLAMTALFGGFPQRFYDAYREVFPVSSGYRERQPLYQLYYLLCHLNLFGESYGTQVDSILSRFAS
jgi:fructosamine-3-kinase